ncbi:MAG: hypothetical protein LBO63_01655 [Oscillospiraceae bacterium]|nr:hypothetical protein [Oscillospiraceae bacterium]
MGFFVSVFGFSGAFSCAPRGCGVYECVQPCAGVAEFESAAKLRLATLLYAYAAGGFFLVLARKEPKKPL